MYYLAHGKDLGILQYNLMSFAMVSISIITFILVFLLLIRKKIAYIRYISIRVKSIAAGDLGAAIRVKGKDELGQLSESINAMSLELKRKFENERTMERTKNDLITGVSHDLRTPLTSILGYIDLLKNGAKLTSEQFYEYTGIIESKAKKLEKLMNELFEYTRLSSPDIQLNLEPIDLRILLEQMMGEYQPIFEQDGLQMHRKFLDEDFMVRMDTEKMVRVFDNLLGNIQKYSDKPSAVSVVLSKKDGKAQISVSNKTESFSAEDPSRLFERFYTGDKSRSGKNGTGLGLPIAKRIVELHQGHIHAAFKEGWLTLTIELPVDV
jgi:signal transduction histidine kinase